MPKSSNSENIDILEKVYLDIQELFPMSNVDGTKMNFKAVDARSGHVHMELITDKSAKTTSKFIERFQKRAERQTGFKMIIVGTDGRTDKWQATKAKCAEKL